MEHRKSNFPLLRRRLRQKCKLRNSFCHHWKWLLFWKSAEPDVNVIFGNLRKVISLKSYWKHRDHDASGSTFTKISSFPSSSAYSSSFLQFFDCAYGVEKQTITKSAFSTPLWKNQWIKIKWIILPAMSSTKCPFIPPPSSFQTSNPFSSRKSMVNNFCFQS